MLLLISVVMCLVAASLIRLPIRSLQIAVRFSLAKARSYVFPHPVDSKLEGFSPDDPLSSLNLFVNRSFMRAITDSSIVAVLDFRN